MNAPSDQSQRDRFIHELDRNFSVVASAGSGKTRAITERIVALARHERACDWLPTLLVVTYTNRAAAEMQQRARQSILEADVLPNVLAAFDRAFFGTIHSLCVKLLRQHGHHLGVPAQIEHVDEGDDGALWMEFVQRSTKIGSGLDEAPRRALLRLIPAQRLMELGRRGVLAREIAAPGPFPPFDFGPVHAFTVTHRGSLEAVARSQEALRRWEQAWAGEGFAGSPPKWQSTRLRDVWEAALAPIVQWRQRAALQVAAGVSQAYRDFRLERSVMTFSDQVALAAALLKNPEAAQRIRAREYRVILDEAQDTDPTQFDVLLEIARPVEATGSWPKEESAPPRAGHFCMVGDFQQSIYGGRADLAHYREVHEALLRTGAGEQLTFSVTFRVDQAALDFVNTVFPTVLHDKDRQVKFVDLQPRPNVFPGQIVRFAPAPLPVEMAGWKNWQKMYWEADQLARWLRDAGLKKLRASSWSEVALLCPRTRWLAPLRAALRKAGLNAQVQSERAIKGDSPAYAWFTALATILAEPRNGYEIVGVLREVFGLSDHELALFSEGHGERFHIVAANEWGGPVGERLNLLAALRERLRPLPLFTAVGEMARSVQLRERLLALPTSEYEGLELELEALLTQAAAAEAMGATLESFATELQSTFHVSRDVRRSTPEAVQIISGHKAKGSEWEAVILPFFARGLTVGKSEYPRLLRDPRTNEMMVVIEGNDLDADLKQTLETRDQQELERLLYVALTRAKHTLVLVDDRAVFAGKTGLQSKAQAKLLRFVKDHANTAAFERLSTTLTPCPVTTASQAEKEALRSQEKVVALPTPPAKMLVRSRARAALFLKRNPSALAEAARAEADPAAYAEMTARSAGSANAGQLYGTWWHNFVEQLAWGAGEASWETAFRTALSDSPDAELSRREWALLRKQLTNGSAFAKLLTARENVRRAEMPFLWAMSDRECLDGILDLAIFDRATDGWCILDWKTNRLSSGGLRELRTHYLPQLSAYWKAASEMLRAPITAGLYSTAAGQWLPYETAELADAWESLRAAPASLAKVLERDTT